MTPEKWSLVFGGLGSALYVGWAIFAYFTAQQNLTGALLCYGVANIFLMWPTIRLYL